MTQDKIIEIAIKAKLLHVPESQKGKPLEPPTYETIQRLTKFAEIIQSQVLDSPREALNYAVTALKDAASRLDKNNDLYLDAIQTCYDALDVKVIEPSQSDGYLFDGAMDIVERIDEFQGDWSDAELIHDAAMDARDEIISLRAKLAQPTSQDVLEYVERLEETLKDAINLRVKLFRGGDFDGDTDKLPDNEIINRESYARKWQKALDSRPDAAMKEGK